MTEKADGETQAGHAEKIGKKQPPKLYTDCKAIDDRITKGREALSELNQAFSPKEGQPTKTADVVIEEIKPLRALALREVVKARNLVRDAKTPRETVRAEQTQRRAITFARGTINLEQSALASMTRGHEKDETPAAKKAIEDHNRPIRNRKAELTQLDVGLGFEKQVVNLRGQLEKEVGSRKSFHGTIFKAGRKALDEARKGGADMPAALDRAALAMEQKAAELAVARFKGGDKRSTQKFFVERLEAQAANGNAKHGVAV